MIGRDIGSTRYQNVAKAPAPSIFAASNSSRGSDSKNRVTSSTLNALAAAGSQTAQKVSMRFRPRIGRSRIVR